MDPTEQLFYADWREWFAQPMSEKLKFLRSPGKGGYYPPASEAPGFTGTPDPKEYFHVRLGVGPYWSSEATQDVFWDCLWRAEDWLRDRGLRELLKIHPKNHVLRIIHYPPSPTGEVGQAHRDFDLLTVSVEGTAPGLEVWDGYHSAQPSVSMPKEDGWSLQETGIQVGEMLEIYTRDQAAKKGIDCGCCGTLEATTHRVHTAPNTERYKAVFFYLPPDEFELRPGFTAADYLRDVLTKAGTYGVGAK